MVDDGECVAFEVDLSELVAKDELSEGEDYCQAQSGEIGRAHV